MLDSIFQAVHKYTYAELEWKIYEFSESGEENIFQEIMRHRKL